MRTALVTIATDTHGLDGAWHEPDGAAARAVQILHGNCMNFYTGPSRFLPPVLAQAGFACLAYNRRGHDILGTLSSRERIGGALQRTHEAIADNVAAGAWLAARGHPAPAVVGHSNGGMLAVRHAVDHPGCPALVLMSAHVGGRDIARKISAAGLFGQDQLDALLAEARERVAAGRGAELMLLPGWWYVITPESLIDYATALPDVLALAEAVCCPTLFLRGDREPPDIYPAEAFAERCAGPCEAVVVPDCDHFYTGREDYVAGLVRDWLSDRIGSPARERAA